MWYYVIQIWSLRVRTAFSQNAAPVRRCNHRTVSPKPYSGGQSEEWKMTSVTRREAILKRFRFIQKYVEMKAIAEGKPYEMRVSPYTVGVFLYFKGDTGARVHFFDKDGGELADLPPFWTVEVYVLDEMHPHAHYMVRVKEGGIEIFVPPPDRSLREYMVAILKSEREKANRELDADIAKLYAEKKPHQQTVYPKFP